MLIDFVRFQLELSLNVSKRSRGVPRVRFFFFGGYEEPVRRPVRIGSIIAKKAGPPSGCGKIVYRVPVVGADLRSVRTGFFPENAYYEWPDVT